MKNTRILLTTTKIVAAFFLIAHLSAIQTRHSLLLTFSATVVDASDLSGGVTNNELFRAIGNGDASAVRDSLVRGGGADVRDASGNTPLVSAILAGGKPEIVRLLLDKGVDVNAGGRGGYTPLLGAAETGRNDIVALFLKKGASVNLSAGDRRTPLMGAASFGKTETVRLLLDNKADINLTDSNGYTALTFAVQNGYTETTKVLLARGADVSVNSFYGPLIVTASGYGRTEIVKALLEKGADVNAANKTGLTALMNASSMVEGNSTIIRVLLEKGANVNAMDISDMTALMYAAGARDKDAVNYLLKRGADVNSKNNNGLTPLMYAASAGKSENVKALLSHGADVNASTPPGGCMWCDITALKNAQAGKHSAVIKLLKNAGAKR